jgi:hypothetical protein
MKLSRWIDHLAPWVVWAATVATSAHGPGALLAMALPLALAGVVEARRLDLVGWRRGLEALAVIGLLLDLALTRDFLGALVRVLFVLMGLRLALPHQRRERRQLLLMAFLVLLTTTISTTDFAFLLAALATLVAMTLALLHLNWEESASLRRGPSPQAPFRRVVPWTLGILGLAAATFVVMPRVTLGMRPFSLARSGLLGTAPGLSDAVDLGKEGPIQPGGGPVLRISPLKPLSSEQREQWARELGLLRGMALEEVDGMAWRASIRTPRPRLQSLLEEGRTDPTRHAEFFILRSRNTLLTVPYGLGSLEGPLPLPLRAAEGGGLRWGWIPSQGFPLRLSWSAPGAGGHRLWEGSDRAGPAWRGLTRLGPEHAAALRASLAFAPGDLPPERLAQRLSETLRTRFRYTLTNPSGGSRNPLEDFLERSQAGHCEYFASALALMLRARNVPARVVNGYRLGPWVEEGNYFLVGEEQAHAWVEWWDEAQGRWRTEDATPAAELGAQEARGLSTWERLSDTLRYRWERYVVRFSNQDQEAGLTWARTRVEGWSWSLPRWPWLLGGAALALLLGLRRFVGRPRRPRGPTGLRQLRPLLRVVPPEAQPAPGETVRAWLVRLGSLRPDRARALAALAEAVEAHAYGGTPDRDLERQARAEARAWRQARP